MRVEPLAYTPGERRFFWMLAVVGMVGLNGAFMYSLFFRPGDIAAALTNPLAGAFIVEALVLTGVLAYLLDRWAVSRVHWAWFVALSLAGGLAFAVPVALLITEKRRERDAPGPAALDRQ